MVPGAWSYLPAAAETLGFVRNECPPGSGVVLNLSEHTTHGGMGGLVSPSMGLLCEIFANLRLKIVFLL